MKRLLGMWFSILMVLIVMACVEGGILTLFWNYFVNHVAPSIPKINFLQGVLAMLFKGVVMYRADFTNQQQAS